MSTMMEALEKDHAEWREMALRFQTALRRIRSLEEKNVPKFAQLIAQEALSFPSQETYNK
jgi:hypothetical protein